MGPDHATGYVRQHLRDTGVVPASGSDGLFIQSSPGTPGHLVSTVRRAMRTPAWEQPFRVELVKALLKLPESS